MSRLLTGLRVGLLVGLVAFGLLALGFSTSMATTRLLSDVEMRATVRGAAPFNCDGNLVELDRCNDKNNTCGKWSGTSKLSCEGGGDCQGCSGNLSNWGCGGGSPLRVMNCHSYLIPDETSGTDCGLVRVPDGPAIQCQWDSALQICNCIGGSASGEVCSRREATGDPNCNWVY